MRRWCDGTNVGDVDLPAAAAGTAHATHGSSETGPTAVSAGTARSHSAAHSAAEAAAGDSSSGGAEAWLSLAVLSEISNSQSIGIPRGTCLSDVDKSTHQVLVAERRDGILGLLPCCVLHNSGTTVSMHSRQEVPEEVTYPHPYKTHGQGPNPSIQRSIK